VLDPSDEQRRELRAQVERLLQRVEPLQPELADRTKETELHLRWQKHAQGNEAPPAGTLNVYQLYAERAKTYASVADVVTGTARCLEIAVVLWSAAGELRDAFKTSVSNRFAQNIAPAIVAHDLKLAGLYLHKVLKLAMGETKPHGEVEAEPAGRRRWAKNRERDQIICNCLGRGMDRRQICEELDRRTIAELPSMQRHKIHRWVDAWDDPGFRNAIQRLFTKVFGCRKSVKPPLVSR
jgi:hypothetical protein